MPAARLPYRQLLESRPLLHALVQTRIKVGAQVAALQAIAAIDVACKALDQERNTIIQANLDPTVKNTPGRFSVTPHGITLLKDLEATEVVVVFTEIKVEDLGELSASGTDLLTLRWLIPFQLETDPPLDPPPDQAASTPARAPEVEVRPAEPSHTEARPAEG